MIADFKACGGVLLLATGFRMIKGKGIYRGNITKTFTITQKDISKVSMWVPDVAYTTKMKAGKYISKPILIDTNGNVLDKADYADVVY